LNITESGPLPCFFVAVQHDLVAFLRGDAVPIREHPTTTRKLVGAEQSGDLKQMPVAH
jgi:hypothetical protein